LITDDGSEIAPLLADRLRQMGVATEIFAPQQGCNHELTAAQVIGRLRDEHGAITRLIHLLPLGGVPEVDAETFQSRLDSELMPLFHLTRELEADLRKSSGGVIAASRLGGSFAIG